MEKLEKILGYKFENINLLKTALTHSSYANENNCKSYERMEFLGDSVLGVIVSEFLFEKMKTNNEGDLSRIRASLVCEESLSKISRRLHIGEFMLLGNGEEKSGNRERNSILADMFESVLAAIYLDSDMETAKNYTLRVMKEELLNVSQESGNKDYKTRLQEKYQKRNHGKDKIEYRIIKESGPDHMKSFVVELLINDKVVSKGSGKSKKEAEQMAAKASLEKY